MYVCLYARCIYVYLLVYTYMYMFVSPIYMVYLKDTLLFYSPAIRATLAIFASHPPTASLCVSSECSYGFASLFKFNITMFSFFI